MKTMNETQLKELEKDLDTIRDQVISANETPVTSAGSFGFTDPSKSVAGC